MGLISTRAYPNVSDSARMYIELISINACIDRYQRPLHHEHASICKAVGAPPGRSRGCRPPSPLEGFAHCEWPPLTEHERLPLWSALIPKGGSDAWERQAHPLKDGESSRGRRPLLQKVPHVALAKWVRHIRRLSFSLRSRSKRIKRRSSYRSKGHPPLFPASGLGSKRGRTHIGRVEDIVPTSTPRGRFRANSAEMTTVRGERRHSRLQGTRSNEKTNAVCSRDSQKAKRNEGQPGSQSRRRGSKDGW